MRGTLAIVAGSVGAFAVVFLHAGAAPACSIAPPPPELLGTPTAGEVGVPTNIVPAFDFFHANMLDRSQLASAAFALAGGDGSITVTARELRYQGHFELVFSSELEPSTEYTLRASLPPADGFGLPATDVTLTFTTGDGPGDPPPPPSHRIEHYVSYGSIATTSCGPPTSGSCLFDTNAPYEMLMVDELGQEIDTYRYLFFGHTLTNVTSTDGNPYTCVALRTRGADGTLSDPVRLCREDGETHSVTGSLPGIQCTETGLTRDGVPIGQSGSGGTGGSGAGTSTGGASTGGVSTGGASTGGTATGGAAGSGTEPDPDDAGERVVITEGCGCSVPGRRLSAAWAWMAVALLALGRRRSLARHRP